MLVSLLIIHFEKIFYFLREDSIACRFLIFLNFKSDENIQLKINNRVMILNEMSSTRISYFSHNL